MRLTHTFFLKHFLLIASVFFLGGCLFFGSDSNNTNNTIVIPSNECADTVQLGDAAELGCDFVCETDLECDSEPGFFCQEGVCEQFCQVVCAGEPDCFLCEGESCIADDECETDFCNESVCEVFDQCKDGLENGDEDGIDCGGPSCEPCDEVFCTEESCPDGFICTDEGICSDCQCGDDDCGSCLKSSCDTSDECESGLCQFGVCVDIFCNNQIQDGDETGVDCGGDCLSCAGDQCDDDVQCLIGECDTAIDRCRASHCAEVDDVGLTRLLTDRGSMNYLAHCDGDWVLLGMSTPDSIEWSVDGPFWSGSAINEVPGDPANVENIRAPAYRRFVASQIKLCYGTTAAEDCFVFSLATRQTLYTFFETDQSVLVNPDRIDTFLLNLGFAVIEPDNVGAQINCLQLALNRPGGNGRIGLMGDVTSCGDLGGRTPDDLALGLGMDLGLQDGPRAGYSRYVSLIGDLTDAPNVQLVGPWFIMAR